MIICKCSVLSSRSRSESPGGSGSIFRFVHKNVQLLHFKNSIKQNKISILTWYLGVIPVPIWSTLMRKSWNTLYINVTLLIQANARNSRNILPEWCMWRPRPPPPWSTGQPATHPSPPRLAVLDKIHPQANKNKILFSHLSGRCYYADAKFLPEQNKCTSIIFFVKN